MIWFKKNLLKKFLWFIRFSTRNRDFGEAIILMYIDRNKTSFYYGPSRNYDVRLKTIEVVKDLTERLNKLHNHDDNCRE